MSKARSIKTDLEQYLTELDKQYGNNKVSIMTPITATDPVISPLKKPVKELIKDANAEMYQTELDKQYGNALPSADSNPAGKKTAKEMIAEANPLAPASATVQPTTTTKKSSPLIKNMTETFQNKVKEQYGVDVGVTSPGMMLDNTTGKEVPVPDPTPIMYAQQQELASPEPQVQAPEIAYKESAEQMAGITPAEPEVDTTTTTYGQQDVVDTGVEKPSVKSYAEWLDDIRRMQEEAANRQYDVMAGAGQNQYAAALEAAQNEHERAINDANNAYALRRATYGAQGESLGRNGLAMSGYSDYADQVAYATNRGEIAAAGANRYAEEENARNAYADYMAGAELQRDQAITNAGISYAENMMALQEQNDKIQAQLYQEIADRMAAGEKFTDEQIDEMGLEGQYAEAAKGGNAQDLKAREEYVNGINKALDAAAGSDPTELFEQLESIIEGDYNGIKIDDETRQAAYGTLAIRQARNVDESNYAAMKKNLLALKAEGKLSTAGYVNALQQIEQSIGDRQYQKTDVRAVRNGPRLEVQMPNGQTVTLDQEAAMYSKTNRSNFKGIGNQMNEFLNSYVGEEPGMLASRKGENRLFVRLNDGWYEVKQNVLTDMRDLLVNIFLGAEYNQDKVGTVKKGIFEK